MGGLILRLCVICPQNDDEAAILARWWERIAGAIPNGLNLTFLGGAAVTRGNVEAHVAGATGIFYFGHGTESGLGCPDTVLDCHNMGTCANAIVAAIACRAARIAEQSLSVGTIAWLGFTDDLLWAEPFEAEFGSAAAAGPAALLAGRDVRTALDSMKARFTELVSLLENQEWQGEELENLPIAWTAAIWDLENVHACGNLEATLLA